MGAPPRTTAGELTYTPGAGLDLVVEQHSPDDQVRLWLDGDAFPRIVLDPQTGSVLAGGGAAAPSSVAGGGGGVIFAGMAPYNIVADGSTDFSTQLQAAADALVAQGGGELVLPLAPGTRQLVGHFAINGAVPFKIRGFGTYLRVPDNQVGMDINNGHGESAFGGTIEGVHIKGNSVTGTTGIRITNTDRIRTRDVSIETCAVGILERTTAAGGTDGSEQNAIQQTEISQCTIGIQYDKSDGSGHFDEAVVSDVALSRCGTGIKFGTGAIIIRGTFDPITFWATTNGTGFDIDVDVRHTKWGLHGEILNSATGCTLIKWGANAINSEFADICIEVGSAFGTNPIDNTNAPANAITVWREGHVIRQLQKGSAATAVVGPGVGIWTETTPYPWVYLVGGSPTNAPMPGGQNGGVAFGSGADAGDVALFRPGAGRIKSTGSLEASTFVMATKPNITGSRGGNVALASLLTSLAAIGLITDGTTA